MKLRAFVALLVLVAVSGCRFKNEFSKPDDAITTASGLSYKVLRVGLGGTRPKPTSTVKVTYTGWTPDGVIFDGTAKQGGQPVEFPLGRMIPAWVEGLQLMVAGQKNRFWVPASLAYGDTPPGQPAFDPNSGRPPTGPLVFDVELLDVRSGG